MKKEKSTRKKILSEENPPLSKEEIRLLLNASKTHENHYLWFRMLYSFGLQLSELVSLRVEDLDWSQHKILIHHSQTLNPRNPSIPLSLRRDLWYISQGKQGEDFLFSGRMGKLRPRTVQKMFSKLEELTGLPISVFRLRRSLASHLIEAGWDLESIQEQLGLSSQKSLRDLLGKKPKRPLLKIFPLEEINGSAA
ncbi:MULTISPECIES: tyrosine-type recombinase/integrase [unclassified Leptospira]|uniref:tyrosine-type recombinase/integrase n=1 Tax=unclassified Leptospira TaxID=2633828 RepID=UPI0002BDBCCE|nr:MULTISPECIES: tyrosine-type recombinase/integrase [unclassified Leptospira]EMK00492.1 site-specific recombinase, phage integrase family [Leptospira sp. B5-022]MCR1793134.1 tyrosine-type recombinase/integrase [Leptospira sp. id769339]